MGDRERHDEPDGPGELPAGSWKATLKRTVAEFREDHITDWAAALTYYSVLSIFPALLALVSVLGLLGSAATQPLLDNLAAVAPGPAQQIFTNAIEGLQRSNGASGALFALGLGGALWSSSAYVAAFMRASNAIYEVQEGRPIWKTLPTRIGTTLVLLVMLAAVTLAVTFTGPLAEQAGNVLGLGPQAVRVWDVAKWPVIVLVVMTMIALIYWAAPNVRQPGFRWITPGSVLGVLLAIVASVAFAFYVANFGSYDRTYGALGGVIVFLVWMWIANIAILLGAELNAELERSRQIERGEGTEEPFLQPRDTRRFRKAS
jgi:membrane protein